MSLLNSILGERNANVKTVKECGAVWRRHIKGDEIEVGSILKSAEVDDEWKVQLQKEDGRRGLNEAVGRVGEKR